MLSDTEQKYVLHWGEMGTRWGVNRTVAQTHALLFLSNHPLHAEEISEILSVARSNVSTSLKELLSWKLVKRVHVMGDRRDHYQALQDVHETFRVIMEERFRREISPTLTVLRECSLDSERDEKLDAHAQQKIDEVLAFVETLTLWYDEMKKIDPDTMMKILKAGAKVRNVLSLK